MTATAIVEAITRSRWIVTIARLAHRKPTSQAGN
jgi:hypothetical protein